MQGVSQAGSLSGGLGEEFTALQDLWDISSLTRDQTHVPCIGSLESSTASLLENSMNRGAWQATVQGFAKSWTQLNTHTHTPITQIIALFINSESTD